MPYTENSQAGGEPAAGAVFKKLALARRLLKALTVIFLVLILLNLLRSIVISFYGFYGFWGFLYFASEAFLSAANASLALCALICWLSGLLIESFSALAKNAKIIVGVEKAQHFDTQEQLKEHNKQDEKDKDNESENESEEFLRFSDY
ncbi:MAG: hypothetical protein FWG90_12610 [Oscillospiraceae bacterium]|nr:hypothetical protein [Oscillospiraceae bacterium]